ncbi:tlde1 domain-containing protein [uncultured Sphingomonas sp.]|uniref:tlde1 domain-containing protein n=1 Tax=uncultured Sphingomonas sp. TaxID=158754 RepID=UPI0035C9A133
MHWRWRQSTGELFKMGDPVAAPFATGYAGAGQGRNDPDLQCVQDIGPIPRGWYDLGMVVNEPAPVTIPLTPDPANDMCGRSGFLIHADSITRPGWASDGCIVIADRRKRQDIAASGMHRLEVVR